MDNDWLIYQFVWRKSQSYLSHMGEFATSTLGNLDPYTGMKGVSSYFKKFFFTSHQNLYQNYVVGWVPL